MPSFKPKTTKKIVVDKKSTVTLDGKHSEHVEQFTKDDETIESLLKERDELLEKNKRHMPKSGTKLDNHMDRIDRIKHVKKEVGKLKKKKMDYMLDNSKYVFGYFENKKKISEGDCVPTNTEALNSFFKIDNIASDAIKTVEKNNTNIIQEYLSNVDRSFLDVGNFVYSTDVCQKCFKGELIPLEDEGVMICNKCHNSVKYLIENDKPSYKEPPKEVCFYAYKKINHFKEILSQFQGKETTQIPDKVIEELLLQIKKERIELAGFCICERPFITRGLQVWRSGASHSGAVLALKDSHAPWDGLVGWLAGLDKLAGLVQGSGEWQPGVGLGIGISAYSVYFDSAAENHCNIHRRCSVAPTGSVARVCYKAGS